jgi:AcrR family transcriptional regulator
MLHAPKQTRSKKTLERILSSARTLMASEGVDSVGITEIVAHANSSVGSFYARFDGKEDLVRHLHERLWTEANGRWEAGLSRWRQDAPAQDRVNQLVELIQDAVGPDHGLRASLTRVLDEGGRIAQTSFDDRVVADALALLADETEIRHPVPPTGIALGVRFTLAAFRDGTSVTRDDALQNGAALTTELGVALRGYWGVGRLVQVGPRSEDTQVEYFDIWG